MSEKLIIPTKKPSDKFNLSDFQKDFLLLEQNNNETNSSVASLDTKLTNKINADISSLNTDLTSKINASNSSISSLDTKLTNKINADVSSLDSSLTSKINASNSSISSLDTRLTNNVNTTNTRIDNVDENKLINVYGAKGDGVSDDTDAIQNALNNEPVVIFPKGVYKTTRYLTVNKGNNLIFREGAVIFRGGDSSHYKMFVNGVINVSNPTGYNGNGDIKMIGGTIDMNCTNNPLPSSLNCTVMDTGHATDIVFQDMIFKNGQNGHYFQVTASRLVTFERCRFITQNHTNTSKNSYEMLQIEPISEASFPTFGAYDFTPSTNITINNCYFAGFIKAIGTHGVVNDGTGIVYCTNIRITNNTFITSEFDMIELNGYNDVVISDNYFYNSKSTAITVKDSMNITIENNHFSRIYRSSIYSRNVQNLTLRGNKHIDVTLDSDPSGTTYAAIRLDTITGLLITGETIGGTSTKYSYPVYLTTCPNAVIDSSCNLAKGVGTITGSSGYIYGDSTSVESLGAYNNFVIYDGELNTENQTATLNYNIRSFSMIVVLGNDNSGTNASLTSLTIPNLAITTGTSTGRFRLIPDSGTSTGGTADDRIDFSFPTSTSIKVDSILGTCRIRKIIGIR